MAGNLTVGELQSGDDGTATRNFYWHNAADGTLILKRGNIGAGTQDILSVANSTGIVTFNQGLALPAGAISSGTYTPTLTDISNGGSFTARVTTYAQVGSMVFVAGSFNNNPAGASATIGISTPIASNFANQWEAGGGGASASATRDAVRVFAYAANKLGLIYAAATGGAQEISFSCAYRII